MRLFYSCTVHFDIGRVHSPTNALFNLKNTLKFTLKYTHISLLHVSVFDHYQRACTEPG